MGENSTEQKKCEEEKDKDGGLAVAVAAAEEWKVESAELKGGCLWTGLIPSRESIVESEKGGRGGPRRRARARETKEYN